MTFPFMAQCHRSQSLDAFFDGIFMDSPRKLAVIGCGCSVATEPVAEISHQWNISQVSTRMNAPAACIVYSFQIDTVTVCG